MAIPKTLIEETLSKFLEGESFEDFLSRFDLTPEEVFLQLYETGHIDPVIFEDLV